jgi:phosphoglycerate dehydrogenase-like enzyme
MVTVCLPENAHLATDLRDRRDVRVVTFGSRPLAPADLAAVEFFVPPYRLQHEVAAALPQMTRLKVVQTLTAGVDWLPRPLPAGVIVCNARSAHSDAVAEWVIAAILTDLKRFGLFRQRQREHRWELVRVEALAGRTVMILGHGDIGEAVEQRLAPFGVDLIKVARRARAGVLGAQEVPGCLGDVDVLVVLLPLTVQTHSYVNARFLRRLPDDALVVNAARGAVVDTDALVDELRRGRLRAILDVTEPEPLPPQHPLWDLPNVTLTPHVAAETPGYERRGYELVWRQLRRYLADDALENVVGEA